MRDGDDKFAAKPVWDPPINPVMKSKFANLVLRDGYAYGLDEVMVECVDIESGKIAWKKRRHPEFGHGQVMLIGETLLVLSETGELALVEATPTQYHELAEHSSARRSRHHVEQPGVFSAVSIGAERA